MTHEPRGRAHHGARSLAAIAAAALIGAGLTTPVFAADDAAQDLQQEPAGGQESAAATEQAQETTSTQGATASEEQPAPAPDEDVADQPLPLADGDVVISEIHYDNAGVDTGEAVEVQAPVGTDLTGWSLVLYNGSNGGVYGTDTLPSPVPDAGVVVVEYPTNGIQNGSPDGIALIDADGAVVELLSYEGELTATDGPAAGLTSTDIGVAEDGSDPAGQSLQRIDGTWTGPAESSFGELNSSDDDGGGDDGEAIELTIADIQGEGAQTPVDPAQPVTTRGVVTGVYATGGFNGYYIQTAGTGGEQTYTASQAVFVYSPATVDDVAVGDHVEVTGYVEEYNDLTEISVAAGDLTVLDETAAPVLPVVDFELPATDAEREVYEGMLVAPSGDYVVSDTYALGGWGDSAFGSIGLGLDGPLVSPTDVAAPGSPEYDEVLADNAARAVTLDDGQSARTSSDAQVPYLTGAPDLRTGVGVRFHEPVIVDYRFQWNFQPTQPGTPTIWSPSKGATLARRTPLRRTWAVTWSWPRSTC